MSVFLVGRCPVCGRWSSFEIRKKLYDCFFTCKFSTCGKRRKVKKKTSGFGPDIKIIGLPDGFTGHQASKIVALKNAEGREL